MKPNKRIEAQARELLNRTGCLRLPVPVDRVALNLGLAVEPADLGEDISGVLIVGDGRGTIGYNASHAVVRQRFSIAHEIGHFVLHQGESNLFIDKTYTVYKRGPNSASGEDLREIQANQFAAALLMPEELLKQEMHSIGFDLADELALSLLAKKFQVSSQSMSFRLSNLGFLANMT